MSNEKILIVDDEEDILELVKYNFDREGYQTLCAENGEEALILVGSQQPDLIILDLMLPGMNGLEITKALKRQSDTRHIPIIMLTARGEESDIVKGLELGADDYITKPFSPKVLLARARAVIRRQAKTASGEISVLQVQGITIDAGKRSVHMEGIPVDLTYSEFQILNVLAKRPGWVFTRSQIIDSVRGDDYAVTDRSVDVQIVGLRKKLGTRGKLIETIRGVGYRFRETP
ncbi:MAG: response regulator transcription factor [Desulfobacterales bacterium]|nr:response regulator transcription factor [Desulfobacterales bacterium]MDD4072995.1 response regulator transcription factor [Desulfobacterales bacterium]MDD4393182.1 response regulator transcription factor [Desulfobacterales bacterium]